MRYSLAGVLFLVCLIPIRCLSQDEPGTTDRIINFPSKFFSRIQGKTADLDKQLTAQTEKYLDKMARRETRLRKKLYRLDSSAAKNLFNGASQQQYAALAQKIRTDTGSRNAAVTGEYQPYTDSLKGSLAFLQQNPQVLGAGGAPSLQVPGVSSPQVQSTVSQLQQLQARMQDADAVKAFVSQRKQQISQYLSQYTNLPAGLSKEYQGMNQDLFYFSQQVRQYKEMLNDPDQLEQKALGLLSQLPAFQQFMKNNGQLAGLFNLPGNYGSPQALTGLQTRDQVSQLIQGQLASGGPGATAALNANMQSAQQQLDGFKDKLSSLGGGSGDIDMPDFKINEQKTKAFWKRLEYGTNFQTTHTDYYFPTVTDLGLSVGYRISNASTAGVGASYKIGWGNGWNHIALSSQGVGLRSFLDIKIKGSFSATGGLEYNYTTPFTSYQQIRYLDYWTQSGLIGVSKTVSVKSRVFKKTSLQLLWDFLSYQQVPKTQPILFRIGYLWQ